jgi:hypothetical protein
MDTVGPFPRVKLGVGVMLATHPYLLSRWWMSRSYISSPHWRQNDAPGHLCFHFKYKYQSEKSVNGQLRMDPKEQNVKDVRMASNGIMLIKDFLQI